MSKDEKDPASRDSGQPEHSDGSPSAGQEKGYQKVSIYGWRNWGDHPLFVVFTVMATLAGLGIAIYSLRDNEDNQAVRQLDPCIDVVGRWDWLTTGGTVAIAEGGGLSWFPLENNPLPAVVGMWTCAEDTGELTLNWSTGLSDRMRLSEDGLRLSGNNMQNQVVISATRSR